MEENENLIKFPKAYRHKRTISGREIWDVPKPPNNMIWEICPYIYSRDLEGCNHCPEWEEDPVHGKVQRGCFGLAEEVCRIIFAMQQKSGSR
jgi:hypothetical protein